MIELEKLPGLNVHYRPGYREARHRWMSAKPELPAAKPATTMKAAEKEHLPSTIAEDLASPAFRHIDDDPKPKAAR